jgi:mercury(II) reductase
MNGPNDFDLAVIGAGSAGFSAAIRGAELGAQVALIGFGTIGGTCVNFGCVPSKTLIRAMEALHQARSVGRFAGLGGTAEVVDWGAVIAHKDDLVADMRRTKYQDLLGAYPSISYRDGPARLTGAGVAVNGETLAAGKVIVATGAAAARAAIPGIDDVPVLTSTTAMEMERLPASLIVVGGGYISCELAQMFARAGVAVTLVMRSRLLPQAEPEIGEALAGILGGEGLAVIDGVAYRAIRRTGTGIALTVAVGGHDETIEAEKILVTTGRRPNIRGLGLEDVGVTVAADGAVEVDEHMRTSRPGTYAAGDVTGRDQFVYMAAYGAKVAADNALDGDMRTYDATAMPWVVFTDPQAAGVGLTEAEARARGLDVRVSTLDLAHVPRALAARDTRGLIKLVAEIGTDRLLGAHVLAPEGGDTIQTAAIAIKGGLTVADLTETLFPYLTTVEGLKLAALAFDKDVSKLSCCAG